MRRGGQGWFQQVPAGSGRFQPPLSQAVVPQGNGLKKGGKCRKGEEQGEKA